MRSVRALLPIVMLAVQRSSVFGGGFAFQHDPIAEKLYRADLLLRFDSLAIIITGAFLVARWLSNAHRMATNLPLDDASYEI